jgi:hypothetical protein
MPLTTAVVEADSMGGGGRPSEAEIVSGVMLLAASCGVMPLGERRWCDAVTRRRWCDADARRSWPGRAVPSLKLEKGWRIKIRERLLALNLDFLVSACLLCISCS